MQISIEYLSSNCCWQYAGGKSSVFSGSTNFGWLPGFLLPLLPCLWLLSYRFKGNCRSDVTCSDEVTHSLGPHFFKEYLKVVLRFLWMSKVEGICQLYQKAEILSLILVYNLVIPFLNWLASFQFTIYMSFKLNSGILLISWSFQIL